MRKVKDGTICEKQKNKCFSQKSTVANQFFANGLYLIGVAFRPVFFAFCPTYNHSQNRCRKNLLSRKYWSQMNRPPSVLFVRVSHLRCFWTPLLLNILFSKNQLKNLSNLLDVFPQRCFRRGPFACSLTMSCCRCWHELCAELCGFLYL